MKKVLFVILTVALVASIIVTAIVVGFFIKYDTFDHNKAEKHLQQSKELRKQGKLAEALDVCRMAATYWDEEGAVSYGCMQIEWQLYGTPTPWPLRTPILTLEP